MEQLNRDNTNCPHHQPVEGGVALCGKDRTAVHCNDYSENKNTRTKHQETMLLGRAKVKLAEARQCLEEVERTLDYISADSRKLIENPDGTRMNTLLELKAIENQLDQVFGGFETARRKVEEGVTANTVAQTEIYMRTGEWPKL